MLTSIKREGQMYVDDPVFVNPKPISLIERALAAVYERQLPRPIQTGHERVQLRWMKPGPNGKLVPR